MLLLYSYINKSRINYNNIGNACYKFNFSAVELADYFLVQLSLKVSMMGLVMKIMYYYWQSLAQQHIYTGQVMRTVFPPENFYK